MGALPASSTKTDMLPSRGAEAALPNSDARVVDRLTGPSDRVSGPSDRVFGKWTIADLL